MILIMRLRRDLGSCVPLDTELRGGTAGAPRQRGTGELAFCGANRECLISTAAAQLLRAKI